MYSINKDEESPSLGKKTTANARLGTEKIGLLTENPEDLEVHFMLNVFVFR